MISRTTERSVGSLVTEGDRVLVVVDICTSLSLTFGHLLGCEGQRALFGCPQIPLVCPDVEST